MLGPECGIIDMSGEMTPSRLYMPQNALWPGCDSHPLSRFLPCVCMTLSDPNCRLIWPLRHVGVQLMVGRGPHRNFEARIYAKTANFIDKVDKLLSAEITRRGDDSEIGNQSLPGMKMRLLWLLTCLVRAS